MLNHIVIMGRLTRFPELRRTKKGTAVASFNVAVERNRQQNGEKKTDFIDVTAWGATAEFVSKYLTKGERVVVEGSLESDKWDDTDGNSHTSWAIHASSIYFADSRKTESEGDDAGEGDPTDAVKPSWETEAEGDAE